MLLRSRPDTVHEFPLRKTRTSTPLTKASPTDKNPRQNITPAIADCRFRAPLTPRLRGNFMTFLGAGKFPLFYYTVRSGGLSNAFFVWKAPRECVSTEQSEGFHG